MNMQPQDVLRRVHRSQDDAELREGKETSEEN